MTMIFFKFFSRFLLAVFFIAITIFATSISAQNTPQTQVKTAQVRAELMAQAPQGVAMGKPMWLGVQLTHQPGWHTYWKNPGDSGLPTQLQWTLPAGLEVGDIAWPAPQIIRVGHLANYGYENTVLLAVPVTVTPAFKPPLLGSDIEVRLKATWLVCHTECIPEEGEFALRVALQGSTALNSAVFNASLQAQPTPLSGAHTAQVEREHLQLTVANLSSKWQGKTLSLFPELPGVIEAAAPWKQSWQDGRWTAQIPLARQLRQHASTLALLVVLDEAGARKGHVVRVQVTGIWPDLAQPASVSPALAAALAANATTVAQPGGVSPSLLAALLGALLGGAILNLMPCVFPVLAIKVVGFARQGAGLGAQRHSGLAYSAGVMLSFVALGGLMLSLRAVGEQLGWGFQLQSPWVVAGLATLFAVIGLNLAGLFTFGQFVPGRLAALELKMPLLNAFLSGVLVVLIASPCTAPFMGAALGLALGLPAAQALLIFASLGLGMALPYLGACWLPVVARLLPRPGAWMLNFQRAMAFPMFATVVWLVWVLGQQSGIDGVAALLALLLALALVLWSLGLQGRGRRIIAIVSITLLALLAGTLGQSIGKLAASGTALTTDGPWQAWEPGRVEQLLAQGQPVFVEFTAAWCVTCQINQQTTLTNPELLAELKSKKVALLRADWTRRDPAISATLSSLGRSGVPVYVFYQNGQVPVLLSELISLAQVRAVLAKL